jgi:hypothetical protein
MEWISVKDRLPETYDLVLMTNIESKHLEDHWVCAGSMNRKKVWYNQFQDNNSDCSVRVTHWMPLPEPPKQS